MLLSFLVLLGKGRSWWRSFVVGLLSLLTSGELKFTYFRCMTTYKRNKFDETFIDMVVFYFIT